MTIETAAREIRKYLGAELRFHPSVVEPVKTLLQHVEQNGWISVGESLPEVEEEILFYSPNKYGVRQGCYDGDGTWSDCYGNSVGKVTHWKPLDPPK